MKIFFILLGLFLALFAIWMLWGWLSVRNIEEPKYTVKSSNKIYEIRTYKAHLIAKTTVEGKMNEALNKGFRRIAAFIFGKNSSQKSVAMTTPVRSQKNTPKVIAMTTPVSSKKTAPNQYTIAFVMPSEYTLKTLPMPLDEKVVIEAIPETNYAVLQFSGYVPENKAQKKIALLQESLKKEGILTQGEAIVSQYNPPWTPWFMRRNEIWIELASSF